MPATKMIPIEGNTYPIKEQLRALGGRWDARRKQWFVPIERRIEVFQLLAGANNMRRRMPHRGSAWDRRGLEAEDARSQGGMQVDENGYIVR